MKIENSIYEVTKEKTNIKGFWKDNTGKVYIDNIKLYNPLNSGDYEAKLYLLFNSGEKAIFVRGKEKSFVEYPSGKLDILENQIFMERKTLSFNEIKDLLSKYNGLTIFKTDEGFIIDIWQ